VWPGGDCECLWITSLAGLRGMVRQRGDHVGLCRPEGHSPVEWRLCSACGLLACQALGAWSGRDPAGLWGGSLGEGGSGWTEERAQGSEIPGLQRSSSAVPDCSSSKSWHGGAFHELGVQSADVSALPGALPQSSMSPVSQQSPWFMELTPSEAVSQSPSWILLWVCYI
jgi:hypothetical protein